MARIKNCQYELLGDSMKLYVEASSKKSLIQRLAAGEEISGYNYSMFGGGGRYMLDDNLADGTIIAIYSKMVQGNPVAKSWGTWTNKVLKSESFNTEARPTGDGVLFYPSDNHVCDFCNIRTPFARIMDENPDSDGSYEDEWGGSYKFICQICAELMSQFQAETFEANGFNLGTIDDPICEICGSNMDEDGDQPLRRGIMFRCRNRKCPDNDGGGQRQQFYEYEESFAAESSVIWVLQEQNRHGTTVSLHNTIQSVQPFLEEFDGNVEDFDEGEFGWSGYFGNDWFHISCTQETVKNAETFEAPYAFNDDRCDNCERSVIDEQDMIRIPIYIDDSEYDVCEVCYDKLIDTSNDFGQTYVSFEATNGWKVTCSKCGVQGHNKSTCGKTPKTYVRKTIKKDDAMFTTMMDQWHTGIRYTQRTGYIMGLTGVIVGWFINNQFFCRK